MPKHYSLLLAVVIGMALVGCSLSAPTTSAPTSPPSATVAATTAGPAPAGQPANPPAGSATNPASGNGTGASQANGTDQPALITGTFTYTNDIITEYYVEHMVALVDMYGFVTRDKGWELPADSQVLGYLKLDAGSKRGNFRLDLPIRPVGTLVDVDNNGTQNRGLQVFAVSYWPNLAGGPFSDREDPSFGWPSYLASTRNDAENNDEVIGGRLVIWAPDGQQLFPTGFGNDGKLFTADDPTGPISAGYSLLDLDQKPFAMIRDAETSVTLYEPNDVAIKDFSDLSYSDAFRQTFEQVRREYAFNGIAGKEPDWNKLYADLTPRVAEAERSRDARGFYLAMQDFASAFKDGHVGLNGGAAGQQVFQEATAAGYGFAIRELDDGRFIVVYVLEGGPAAQAGMQVGAEITAFNDQPIKQAVSAVRPFGSFSTDFGLRYQQARYLLRGPEGSKATMAFTNPDGAAQSVTLDAVTERQSFAVTSLARGQDPNALPVEFHIMDSGAGYIKINSNNDDLNLIVRLFERALKTFELNQLPGVIIDMRQNNGGAPLELAGFLTDKEIPLGQLEYFSEESGKFEPEGIRDKVHPKEQQYQFNKLVLLVNQSCYSACEIESYGFSQVPGTVVIGQYPTAGVEAEVARGQFLLPEGMALQVPTGRFTLPDGSIFLEGKGVQPTVRVPIDEQTVLSQGDPVLERAEQEISG